jgi:hypothetical protein
MISDQEFLYGAAFLRLLNSGQPLTITHVYFIHPSIYLVENQKSKSAILFKVSKKPKSAWSFTFSRQETSALDKLQSQYPELSVFIALICHKDGICCIAKERLENLLNREAGTYSQYISVSRQPRSSYHVNGSGKQTIEQTVPQNDWPRVVLSQPSGDYE